MNIDEFIKYDWSKLQTIQLDGCEIDDNAWYILCAGARYYFPNLKNVYLGIF